MKKIKSFEDACKALNISTQIPEFQVESGASTFYQIEIITRALNGNWKADWNDSNQYKYFPWFAFRGGRLVFADVLCACSNADLGSRLCYKDEETAEYAGKQFIKLYQKMLHPGDTEEDYSDLL